MKKIRNLYLSIAKNFSFLPASIFISIQYESVTQKKLDLKNPITFNEKIQWYKLYYKNPLFQKLANKLSVREYITEKVGKEYLNNLIGIYERPNDIDFDKLPEKFVIKCVHGSGFNLIIDNKSKLNINKTLKTLKKWQSKNFYNKGKEWSYKGLKPTIIIEDFLEDKQHKIIPDYKFFCFDGKIKFIQVDLERNIYDYRCYYDINWHKLDFNTEKKHFFSGQIEKPYNISEMIFIAEKLSENIPFVRVDLYSVNNKTVFGELTFYPGNGTVEFTPKEMNNVIGSYFNLPKKL